MINFGNYEVHKMVIYQPEIINYVILSILTLVCLFSLRKGKVEFLDKTHTDQLRGLAIILVVIGHLWVHVSQNPPKIVLSGFGVALFLILSGFGLSKSAMASRPTFKQFLVKRINRIYVPYWLITIVILILDYVMLNRIYSGKDIFLTFWGVNISAAVKRIDYVRWYVTFLLFWYGIFFFSTKFNNRLNKVLFFFLTAFVIFLLDYRITRLGWYQIFSFPFGVLLAYYYEEIGKYLEVIRRLGCYNLLPLIGLFVVVVYELHFGSIIERVFPSIIYKLVGEGISLFFCFSIILLVGYVGYKNLASKIFCFVGTIAYELFLLHGPFLIKYNPILSSSNLVVSFYFWLTIVLILSYFLHKEVSIMYKLFGLNKYQFFR